ncbi:MAG: hypothetical protein M1462_08670 [Candidatus Thermoplasmatota archaeon]|uniref:Trm112 family protein n=1 Tax=Ferroplasma sp. TaxID=2591003 RepID=UPI002630B1F9|nr:Trm112 family protein [Ferroplasma sp.]MCL4312476.1 hypothetical protein [Candidatus Thermoplasmatota archaeon]
MEYNLIELIACPMCKNTSFSLTTISRSDISSYEVRPVTEKSGKEPYNTTIEENHYKGIIDGVLLCDSCGRWYPIVNSIYVLLPDIFRDEKVNIEFLIKYKTQLPETIVNNGKPFNLGAI